MKKIRRALAVVFIAGALTGMLQTASAGPGGYEDDIGWNNFTIAYVCVDLEPNNGTPCRYGGGRFKVRLLP